MKLDFNFDGKTLLKKWWEQVKANFLTIQNEHNNLSDKVSDEVNQRINLGKDLSGKIATEISERKAADNLLESKITNEQDMRKSVDNNLRERIENEITERQSADEMSAVKLFKKAEKTDLYGTEESVTHTITHNLAKSDFTININAAYGNGTVTINSLAVQNKIFMDGKQPIQTESISAEFSAEKGEEGEKYINILYFADTGKLGLEVTEQPESGNIAKMNVTYMNAVITEMYDGRIRFDSINDLSALKTNSKGSFLEAINEIVDGKVPINHASNTSTYGIGNSSNFGHLKLSDSVGAELPAGRGYAATPKAVKTAYNKAVEAYDLADGKMDKTFSSNGYTTIDEITEKVDEKIGLNDIAYGTNPSDGYYLSEIVKEIADSMIKCNEIGAASIADLLQNVDDIWCACCSYGFRGPLEVVEAVAELKKNK